MSPWMLCCSPGGTCQVEFRVKHNIQNLQREPSGPLQQFESKSLRIKGMRVRRGSDLLSPARSYGTILQYILLLSEIESTLCHLKRHFFFFLHLKHYACPSQSPILLVKGLFILVLKLDCSFIVHF